jgi:octopine/nopaline transport system permease protein
MAQPGVLELLSFESGGWAFALLRGLAISLACASIGYTLGVLLGFWIALGRLSTNAVLRGSAAVYTTVLRGVPPLLVIFLLFFGANGALMWIARGFGHTGYIEINAFTVGALAVALVTAAYASEVLRGAYLAIPKGQFDAYASLGLRPANGHRLVILPQMLRTAIPGLGNVWILALKETALLSVISLAELMRVAGLAGRTTGQPFVFYGAAACLYILVIAASTKGLRQAEARMRWA